MCYICLVIRKPKGDLIWLCSEKVPPSKGYIPPLTASKSQGLPIEILSQDRSGLPLASMGNIGQQIHSFLRSRTLPSSLTSGSCPHPSWAPAHVRV